MAGNNNLKIALPQFQLTMCLLAQETSGKMLLVVATSLLLLMLTKLMLVMMKLIQQQLTAMIRGMACLTCIP
jgi:hypothetical protein